MVRNIVLVKLAPDQDPVAVAKAQQAFLDLNCPGTLSYVIGDDLRIATSVNVREIPFVVGVNGTLMAWQSWV